MTAVGLVHVEHRRPGLALEADQAVGVVLEQVEAALGGQRDQPQALRLGERAAGGVVEVGDDVGERRVDAGASPRRRPSTSTPSASSGTPTRSAPIWLRISRVRS